VLIAPNGKPGSVINESCNGNARMCGYVAGTTSRSANPHTRAYAATFAAEISTSVSRSVRSGMSPPPPPTNGSWEAPGIIAAPARANSAGIEGELFSSRVAI